MKIKKTCSIHINIHLDIRYTVNVYSNNNAILKVSPRKQKSITLHMTRFFTQRDETKGNKVMSVFLTDWWVWELLYPWPDRKQTLWRVWLHWVWHLQSWLAHRVSHSHWYFIPNGVSKVLTTSWIVTRTSYETKQSMQNINFIAWTHGNLSNYAYMKRKQLFLLSPV